ncbi:hypothetical protein BGZ80_001568 [Entomortierella chlamydospora]|uniref:Uncharacterized protein n=1 Tax=Entomortierella chlamydospora TaxID=101097 RepID=A0A9P6T3C1_9FUNG|nr:hypothetical protein BGZ80_001568 [Entomortierella chlamydospora]
MQQQPKAPTLQDIEQKYSQLPPQYRQAVLEKHQREHQQLLLQQQQQGQSQVQPQLHQQQQPQRQTLRPEPGRNQSVSLSSSPNEGAKSGSNGAWSSTRQRISSAPLTSTYRSSRDNDSLSSVSSNFTGPGRAHWKPDSSTNFCTWPGCRLEFSLFDRRHHCRKPNTGYIPDGYLGGDNTREGIGREDIVRQTTPSTGNIAIKRQPSIGQQQPDASTLHAEHVKAGEELEKFLQERPAPEELVEKNILKGSFERMGILGTMGIVHQTDSEFFYGKNNNIDNIEPKVAPSLQHQAEELKKAQLEDALNSKLEHRPPVSELIEHNIIHEPHVAPSLQKQADELKRSQLEDTLMHKIDHRPTPSELIEHNILHKSDVYPEHQREEEEAKRLQLEKDLNAKLERRPSMDILVEKHILV